jgi:hypothetical protein
MPTITELYDFSVEASGQVAWLSTYYKVPGAKVPTEPEIWKYLDRAIIATQYWAQVNGWSTKLTSPSVTKSGYPNAVIYIIDPGPARPMCKINAIKCGDGPRPSLRISYEQEASRASRPGGNNFAVSRRTYEGK